MTAQQAILSLGTCTLAGCGGGLVLIHGTNPLLKGLNWMGNALVVGGLAAALYLFADAMPALEPLANLCTLLAFTCCYRADRYLIGLEARIGRLCIGLVSCQLLAVVLQWVHLLTSRNATVLLSLLLAAQVANTVRLILQNSQGRSRQPGRATVIVMSFLIAADLARGTCAALGLLNDSPWAETLNLLSYGTFVAFAIGLAFAFFWRATTRLRVDLEHMASTDPLTRVFNRRVFLNWCESEQARSHRLHTPFSVLMLDFDHFKKINDTYGHHVGDQVLCAAVERIQDSIRGIDVLCRWGGEEFTVLLPNASEEATLIVAERVRRNIHLVNGSDSRFSDEIYGDLQLTASIGTATYEGDDDTFHFMLQRADSALYEAKRTGRNRVVRSLRPRGDLKYVPGQLTLNTH